VALNQTHSVERSVAPSVSEYCSAKVCVVPEPLLGVAESAVMPTVGAGGGGAGGGVVVPVGTVHVPRCCQALFTLDPFAAYI